MKVELELSSYATKTDLKSAAGIDKLSFAKKVDLATLKSNVGKLDIDKLKNVPTYLSNLEGKVDKLNVDKLLSLPVDLSKVNVVKNDAVKKDLYNAKIKTIEDKIHNITSLATKTSFNAKTNEVKGEIPSTTNLATKAALTVVENKIPSVSNLVKKTDYNTKTKEVKNKIADHNHDKYITTPEFNKLTSENFAA